MRQQSRQQLDSNDTRDERIGIYAYQHAQPFWRDRTVRT